MKIHKLKIRPQFFNDIAFGRKTFELRKDDRVGGYQVGDRLKLMEYNSEKGYTGRWYMVEITYKLAGFSGLIDGYCLLGIKPLCGIVN